MKKNSIKIKLGGLPLPYVFFGYILIILGLFQSLWYLTPIFIVLGLLLVTAKDYLEIKFDTKTIFKYSSFLFFKKGETIDISEADHIAMVRVNLSQQVYNVSVGNTYNSTMIVAYLIFNDNKKLKLFRKNYKQNHVLTKQIAQALHLRIMDASTGEKKWLEPEV